MIPLLALLPLAAPQPVAAREPDRDSVAAYRAVKQGRILPLPEIEKRVLPTMKGSQYIGFNLELPSGVYTLKFLKDGTVIWVDVDGRSGQIIGRTGN